jgi:DNA anti-recombination protein RmuC
VKERLNHINLYKRIKRLEDNEARFHDNVRRLAVNLAIINEYFEKKDKSIDEANIKLEKIIRELSGELVDLTLSPDLNLTGRDN